MLHVVAAVIANPKGDILITRRASQAHQGDRWEFPGGKVESNESVEHALARELNEELGIDVLQARPLIRVLHHYPKQTILLDVWYVEQWQGEAWGREGQPLLWCHPEQLSDYHFPDANYPIIDAIFLPDFYVITPEPTRLRDKAFFNGLSHVLAQGQRLIQLRAKALYADSLRDYCHFAENVLRICAEHRAELILNADVTTAQSVGSHGVHLTSERLFEQVSRPLSKEYWVSASCHHASDLVQAQRIQTDFVVISPVRPTLSHPDGRALGWLGFFRLVEQAHCPAYALGGLQQKQLHCARAHGAQGIAGIRDFWLGKNEI
ncbi:Nudix family hydrolase [Thioflexithrix psekupsensis]|uniref:8-oxo-dGTP diphosphatase n=1 Tax=Thioflexithrix psekupsensis TaxID=1570016 RepID=A0A251X8F7_9GAMM|nr:Nudix family hydrolase [Thioflexithrix psekupsensis]OUD14339.1 hypothetical protein TPSD3_08455 [Thioflexithrix psekupsensis]